ncbi:MAG TPA: class I SAM-dependent methyltransferase [Longimicrobiales bacterium]|nr:class I SAM-dependent methyltransferase [Longimicrobiales bacterium]
MSIRDALFERYESTHARYLEGDLGERAEWFRDHVALNYGSRLPDPATAPAILEVGCGKGFLLGALASAGYTDLAGVDLSAADLEEAGRRFTLPALHCADAFDFMTTHAAAYDVVIAKAVLEHVRRDDTLAFLESMRGALRPGGRVIIEVPNMDWLFAQHERHMDFTHETGFTRESLAQVLRLVFPRVDVQPVRPVLLRSRMFRFQRSLVMPVVRRILNKVMLLMGEGADGFWWENRSLIAVADMRTGGVA